MAKTKKRINLALQGGGAHGAFTWGLLDRFLEVDLFDIEGVSATSAGSMNAIMLAQGFMENGAQGARDALYRFWKAMSETGKNYGLVTQNPLDMVLEPYLKAPVNFFIFNNIINMLSPYQFNPGNIQPIKEVLIQLVDIKRLKKYCPMKLFICATNVQTGKIHIFEKNELSIDAVLASACLPKLFQAIKIKGEYYWDGGYLGNPAIFPLIYQCHTEDIIIMQTVPTERMHIPKTVAEIDTRLREISFNSSLLREMRAIAFVSKLIENKWLKQQYEKKLRQIYLHTIRADKHLTDFPLSTVYVPEWEFLQTLFELGRKEADNWIKTNYKSIGKKTTVNFDEWL